MAPSAPALDGDRIAVAFERVPSLVRRLRGGVPYATVDEVMDRAREAVREMSEAERIALLEAHPRIGAPSATLSAASATEQGADADVVTRAELEALNGEYERRFGFRCVIFVAGRAKADLVPAMRARLQSDRAAELETGLAEFLAIARDRLSQ